MRIRSCSWCLDSDIEMTEARAAKNGDTVQVHYTGTLDDGEQFDSSRGRDPLSFTVGSGQVNGGFDEAVRGLTPGQSRTVHIEPAAAYGSRDEARVLSIPAAEAPDGLRVGDRVQMGNQPALVTEVTAETVTVDANHELAGKALNFDVQLISID